MQFVNDAPDKYWLLSWVDDQGIRTVEDAERCLKDSAAIADLRAKAHQAEDLGPSDRDRSRSIVAGAGIDLSGSLDCPHRDCRKRKVEDLFRRAWHYFDRVIIADPVGHAVTHHWRDQADGVKAAILDTIHVLLYLREIGAETLVEYFQKPLAHHERNWLGRAEQAGLRPLVDAASELQDQLIREARIDFSVPEAGHVEFWMEHPMFEHAETGRLNQEGLTGMSENAARMAAVGSIVQRYLSYLTADVRAARTLCAPLGSAVLLHREMLSQANQPRSPAAFCLQLPVLDGIPVKTLLKIRLDESEYFDRFRHRLREAIRQRSAVDSGPDTERVADEIRNDLVEPELRKIRDRLAASQQAFSQKAAVGTLLGALTTTCGLMVGISAPLAYGAGIASVTALWAKATEKYIEDRRDVSLDDMYFLWRAARHSHHEL